MYVLNALHVVFFLLLTVLSSRLVVEFRTLALPRFSCTNLPKPVGKLLTNECAVGFPCGCMLPLERYCRYFLSSPLFCWWCFVGCVLLEVWECENGCVCAGGVRMKHVASSDLCVVVCSISRLWILVWYSFFLRYSVWSSIFLSNKQVFTTPHTCNTFINLTDCET